MGKQPAKKKGIKQEEEKQQKPKKQKVELTRELATERIVRTGGTVRDRVISHPGPGLRVLSAIEYLVRNHNYTYTPKGEK